MFDVLSSEVSSNRLNRRIMTVLVPKITNLVKVLDNFRRKEFPCFSSVTLLKNFLSNAFF